MSFCAAHQRVPASSCQWGTAGRKPSREVAAGMGPVLQDASQGGERVSLAPRVQPTCFIFSSLQRVDNGSIIASITFVILSLLFFKLNSPPREVTESTVTAGFYKGVESFRDW